MLGMRLTRTDADFDGTPAELDTCVCAVEFLFAFYGFHVDIET
jgi:hypothetical protein